MQRIVSKFGRLYRSVPRSVNTSLNHYNKSVPRLQYSTNNSFISHKSVANNRDLINRSVPKNIVIFTTDADIDSKVKDIKFFADENVIEINFRDGQTISLNSFWLRDSCNCDQCVHPLTKTKLFNCANISEDLFVDRFDCFDDIIEIHWKSGQNDGHISRYAINWLQMFADVFETNPKSECQISDPNDGFYGPTVPLPPRVLWDSNQIDKQKMSTNYHQFMESNESLKNVLQMFCRFGFAFLEGVPIEKTAILSVARRIAYERQTSYGSTFDVIFKSDPKAHIAYTGALIEPHVDLPYRERSPGAQMLHCLEMASVGGSSTLVDGFKCAESLRQTNSELFDVLTRFPVLFSFCDKEKGIWFREKWPIIALQPNQTLKEIHFSPISMRPPLLPLNVLDKFYEAYRALTALVKDDRFVYRFQLRPGDLILFNNRRVLHGREQFDHLCQRRHLLGCYMDLDEIQALYEKLIHCH